MGNIPQDKLWLKYDSSWQILVLELLSSLQLLKCFRTLFFVLTKMF